MAAAVASKAHLFGNTQFRRQKVQPPRYVAAKAKDGEAEKPKQESVFSGVMNALNFSTQVSEEDAALIEAARETTKKGQKMTREQYAALRRKVGGTARDFFKDSIQAEGAYVEAGWVDKTCKICGKDTSKEPRTTDRFGRYAHVECLEAKGKSGNFFTRLFGG